jgi:hypothetical protein
MTGLLFIKTGVFVMDLFYFIPVSLDEKEEHIERSE